MLNTPIETQTKSQQGSKKLEISFYTIGLIGMKHTEPTFSSTQETFFKLDQILNHEVNLHKAKEILKYVSTKMELHKNLINRFPSGKFQIFGQWISYFCIIHELYQRLKIKNILN